jgi:hypothetical protein
MLIVLAHSWAARWGAHSLVSCRVSFFSGWLPFGSTLPPRPSHGTFGGQGPRPRDPTASVHTAVHQGADTSPSDADEEDEGEEDGEEDGEDGADVGAEAGNGSAGKGGTGTAELESPQKLQPVVPATVAPPKSPAVPRPPPAQSVLSRYQALRLAKVGLWCLGSGGGVWLVFWWVPLQPQAHSGYLRLLHALRTVAPPPPLLPLLTRHCPRYFILCCAPLPSHAASVAAVSHAAPPCCTPCAVPQGRLRSPTCAALLRSGQKVHVTFTFTHIPTNMHLHVSSPPTNRWQDDQHMRCVRVPFLFPSLCSLCAAAFAMCL